MVIKTSKKQLILSCVVWCVISALPLLFFVEGVPPHQTANLIKFILIYEVVIALLMVKELLLDLRTLEMSKDGCTVKLLWFKTHYKWEDLKTKSIEKGYRQRLWGRGSYRYDKGVVFSKREKFHTPDMIGVLTYSVLCLNPFKFFYVLFTPPEGNDGIAICEVNESVFMEKMKEYGVELTEYSYYQRMREKEEERNKRKGKQK